MTGETSAGVSSLAIVILFGVIVGRIAEKVKLPKMVFLIVVGITYNLIYSLFLVNLSDETIKTLAFTFAELANSIISRRSSYEFTRTG